MYKTILDNVDQNDLRSLVGQCLGETTLGHGDLLLWKGGRNDVGAVAGPAGHLVCVTR